MFTAMKRQTSLGSIPDAYKIYTCIYIYISKDTCLDIPGRVTIAERGEPMCWRQDICMNGCSYLK